MSSITTSPAPSMTGSMMDIESAIENQERDLSLESKQFFITYVEDFSNYS